MALALRLLQSDAYETLLPILRDADEDENGIIMCDMLVLRYTFAHQ